MFLLKAFVSLWNAAQSRQRAAFRDLYPPAQFARVLARERARSDRTGDEFSLLVFTPQHDRSRQAALVCLARLLKRRLRLTDEIGWLDARRIGVALSATPQQGAWKVADDVCRSFPSSLPLPACEVYVYPSPWWQGEEKAAAPEDLASPDKRRARAMETFFVRPVPLWKRLLDVIGALAGMVLLLPLFLAVAVAIKATSRGPVFFKQWRAGLGGKPFLMYKFRSMVVDAEARKEQLLAWNEQDGPAFKIKADPRVTLVGRLLRSTSLDELPQLWNVLKGEMSLVGPRPLPCHESAACRGWLRRRLDVTPGLTCIWQVSGRSRVSFADWVRMDLRYVRSRSLGQDLKLVLQTLPALLFRRGF